MKRLLNLEKSSVRGGTAEFKSGCASYVYLHAGKGEVYLSLEGLPGAPDGDSFEGAKYLVIDLKNPQPTAEHVFARLYERDSDRCITLNAALFPGIRARAVLRLDLIDSKMQFPPLTPTTLKMGVNGDSVSMDRIDRMAIGLQQGYLESRSLEIFSAWITDEMPDFPAAEFKTADRLGQWIQKEWPGKIHSIKELTQKLESEEKRYDGSFPRGWSRYGGCLSKRFEATGYFRTQKDGDRWYLADPDGYAFFSTGVFGVYPGEPGWILGVEDQFEEIPPVEGRFAPAFARAGDLELFRRKFSGLFPDDTLLYAPATANLIRALGPRWYDRWAKMTAARLRSLGVNTLSMFSDPEFIRRSGMPYVIMLKGYPVTKVPVFREFPDVFSAEYEELSQTFAKQLETYAEDPLMIGYFLNNEPTWGFIPNLILAEKLLETGKHTDSLDALIAFLKTRYKDDAVKLGGAWHMDLRSFEDLRRPLERASERSEAARADLTDFTGILIERYAAVPALCAKKAAPNHLCLGMRFANMNNDALLKTAKYFDVFSFNCYRESPDSVTEELSKKMDMPMMVGEFHFGALDAGLPAPSLFCVGSQRERGEAYMRYMQRMARQRTGVGAHYFAYNDQPLWGRYDGENYQFGFVDICNMPYVPFTDRVRETAVGIYENMEGLGEMLGGETRRI